MLKLNDKEIEKYIELEQKRQDNHIELIASENFCSEDVMKAAGSILTNKYAEGYPGRRYYGGCEYVDLIEQAAIDRAKKIFNANFANVQPHSGSQANAAAFFGLLNPGDKILGMALDAGGHLTHGYKLNMSGNYYKSATYGVDKNGFIDYDEVLRIAQAEKPKLIIAGASAYPRLIDFSKFREIADKVGALLMADIAHIAGLVVAGLHQSPLPYADVVTTTTHKTLRGPRGGLILTNSAEVAKKVNSAIFPGLQGGPLEHIIAAKAICFKEASSPEFKKYMQNVVNNCNIFATALKSLGFPIISGGTENHLLLMEVKSVTGLTGKKAEELLHEINITSNKNTVPNDPEKPFITSGLRLGTAAMTTKGLNGDVWKTVAEIINRVLRNSEDKKIIAESKLEVIKLIKNLKK